MIKNVFINKVVVWTKDISFDEKKILTMLDTILNFMSLSIFYESSKNTSNH